MRRKPAKSDDEYAMEGFTEWQQEFESKPQGHTAIQMIRVLPNNDGPDWEKLELRLFEACFQAKEYSSNKIEDVHPPEKMQQTNESVPQQKSAVSFLIRKITSDEHSAQKMLQWSNSNEETRIHGIDSRASRVDVFKSLLTAYQYGLNRFPGHVRVMINSPDQIAGCLWYPQRGRRTKPLTERALTCLVFELTAIMRLWSKKQPLKIQGEAEMPRKGKSHYEIVAAFVRATFPDQGTMTALQVENRLTKLLRTYPGITYVPWY